MSEYLLSVARKTRLEIPILATRGVSEFLRTGRAPRLSIVGEVPLAGPPTAVEPEYQPAVEAVVSALLDWQMLDGYEVPNIVVESMGV